MYTVYKHTAPNVKVYIGITKQKPGQRWRNGNGYKDNEHFYRAIRKYTWENFKHEIICQAPMSAAQAGAVGKSFIALYDSTNPDKGYNHSIGGDKGALGHKPSESVRKAWSEKHKGQVPWNKGRHMSIDARMKMSEKAKGRTPWNKGMAMPDEHRQKLSVAHKGQTAWNKGKHPSPETLRKMSEVQKGKPSPNRKKVLCIETNKVYDSMEEASKETKANKSKISDVCRGARKTAGCYHWQYADYGRVKNLAAGTSKYHAKKTVVDGIEFDSAKEAKRYTELRALEEAGKIHGLRLQVTFALLPNFKCDGVKYRGINYVADFVYYRNGKLVVEDVKGVKTPEYKLKKKLMAYINYINIEES